MNRISLANALVLLSPAHYAAIERVGQLCNGATHLDDLAFVLQLLVHIDDAMDDSPVGWSAVAAHRALLEAAVSEGLISEAPEVRRLPTRQEEIDQIRKAHEHEMWGMQERVRELEERLAQRDRDDEERLRIREEDQRRADRLNSFCGGGAG